MLCAISLFLTRAATSTRRASSRCPTVDKPSRADSLPDRHWHATSREWESAAERNIERFQNQGVRTIKATARSAEFVAWCRRTGRNVDTRALLHFANEAAWRYKRTRIPICADDDALAKCQACKGRVLLAVDPRVCPHSRAKEQSIIIMGAKVNGGSVEMWKGICGAAYMTSGDLADVEVSDLHDLLETYLIAPTGR